MFSKNKSGQGLSITTIVAFALALIVLVIISMIFIGQSNKGGETLSSCETFSGRCFSQSDTDVTGDEDFYCYDVVEKEGLKGKVGAKIPGASCTPKVDICCLFTPDPK